METLLQWLTVHAEHAHYLLFGLLVLAGFSLPVSEELILVIGGVLASSIIPEHTVHLFLAVFLGCYFSDWIAYWLGRSLGERLYHIKWLSFAFSEKRVTSMRHFYAKYGFYTLFFGRFIPFGVRNGIFMSAGIGKMHFGKFAFIDGIGCLFFSLLIFTLAYSFGRNYEVLSDWIQTSCEALFYLFVLFVACSLFYSKVRKKNTVASVNVES